MGVHPKAFPGKEGHAVRLMHHLLLLHGDTNGEPRFGPNGRKNHEYKPRVGERRPARRGMAGDCLLQLGTASFLRAGSSDLCKSGRAPVPFFAQIRAVDETKLILQAL